MIHFKEQKKEMQEKSSISEELSDLFEKNTGSVRIGITTNALMAGPLYFSKTWVDDGIMSKPGVVFMNTSPPSRLRIEFNNVLKYMVRGNSVHLSVKEGPISITFDKPLMR